MRRIVFALALILFLAACGSAPVPTAGTTPQSSGGVQVTTAPQATEAPKATDAPKPTAVPEPTAAPTAEPTPEPAEAGTSRSNPLPLGTGLQFKTWVITVTEVLKGDEAAKAIKETNQFNDPAPEGMEYLLATVQIENIGKEQKAEHTALAADLRLTGDHNILYSRVSAVTPKEFEGELFPGGSAEGQIAFLVPKDEKNLMFFVSESFSFDADARRFVAIDKGASLAPSADLAAVAPNDAGKNRTSPAKPNETVITDEWEVTVVETKRGDEAANIVKDANQFNDPPKPDMEYVAVKLRVRYLGGDDPDKAENVGFGLVKITGEKNKVYDRVSAVPPDPELDGFLFPGGQVEGWDILAVAKGEQKLVLVFEPPFSFSDKNTRFLGLE